MAVVLVVLVTELVLVVLVPSLSPWWSWSSQCNPRMYMVHGLSSLGVGKNLTCRALEPGECSRKEDIAHGVVKNASTGWSHVLD